jgi:hypothetical protein
MKLPKATISLSFSVLSLLSCGGASRDGGQQATSGGKNTNAAAPDAKIENTCLLGFADKLDKLLTIELAAEAAQLPASEAKVNYFTALKNPTSHSVKYIWKSDRTRSMEDFGMTGKVPVSDVIELHGIGKKSLSEFKRSRRPPTEEELKQMDKAFDDALDKKSGNKKIDEKVNQLDEIKFDKSTQKSVTGKMGGMFAKIGAAYRDVGGLGDAASWNAIEHRLYVLDKGVEISLTVELTSEESVNQEKAIALVKALLLKCN